jgi:hypothetical protein
MTNEDKNNFEIKKIMAYQNEDQYVEFEKRLKKLSKRKEKTIFKETYDKDEKPELRKLFHQRYEKYINEVEDGFN